MDVWIVVVVIGAIIFLLGTAITARGLVLKRRDERGLEDAAEPGPIAKIVDALIEQIKGLIDLVLKGNIIAFGLLLIVIGGLVIGGGIWGASRNDGGGGGGSTTTTEAQPTTTG